MLFPASKSKQRPVTLQECGFVIGKLTVTLGLRVPPEQLSTLAAGPAPEAGSTGTLTADLQGTNVHS